MSRSGIAHLRKHGGMARPGDVFPKAEEDTTVPKTTFEEYEPGFIYIDIEYLPPVPDESARR